jgi:nuclear pore complex protein Nup107
VNFCQRLYSIIIDFQKNSVTRDLLNNVLLFPDKGWLIDPEPNDDNFLDDLADDEREMWLNRKNQLDNLRKICIPDIVLLLHNVFTNTGQHQQCIKLADELASESNQLYQVFSKHKLAELLTKITESSLALMNEKKDPFGYVVT